MGSLLGVPIPVWVFLGLALLFGVLLTRTRYGRYVCAVGSNERVATYSAIKVDRVKFVSYVLVGLTVAVSAVLLSSRLNSVSSTNFEMDAISAVIIGGTPMSGGTGTISGTVIGAVILGIVNNMLNMLGVSPYLQGTVKGLVIISAVLIQRRGKK
jgi:ribose transport system permease protein